MKKNHFWGSSCSCEFKKIFKIMKVYRTFTIPKKFNNSVIAIGNFDGLHLGHQEVINAAKNFLNLKKSWL